MENKKKCSVRNPRECTDTEQVLLNQFSKKCEQLKDSELEIYLRVVLFLSSFFREPFRNTDWDKGFLWGCYKTALDLGIIDFPPEWEEKDPIRELTRFNRSVLVTREEDIGLPCCSFQKKREFESEFDARPIMQAEFEETKKRHIENGNDITCDYISSDSAFIKVGDLVYQWQIEDLV